MIEHVLVTGANGILGTAVLSLLLNQTSLISVLVRGNNSNHALERLQDAIKAYPWVDLKRIKQVISGDLCNVNAFSSQILNSEPPITHVLNIAGSTSFSNIPLVWKTNVDGTLALASLVSKLPYLQKFLHISTAFLFNKDQVEGGQDICEDEFPKESQKDYFIEYTKSKAEAERQLKQMRDEGFPLVIVRPSIIVGHSELGCIPTGSIFWAFRAAERSGVYPCPPSAQIDVVPMDYVAKVLLAILFKPHCDHSLYHISSGAVSSSAGEIFNALREANASFPVFPYIEGTLFNVAERAKQEPSLFGPITAPQMKWLLQALKKYLYFASMGITFNNERVRKEFGMQPPPLATYIPTCMTKPPVDIVTQFLEDLAMFDPSISQQSK